MDGSDACSRGVGSNERRQDKRDWEKILHIVERLCNFGLKCTFETGGFYPCVLGEPLVHDATQRTVGSAKKYRGGAEGSWFNISVRGDCLPGLRATDHNHAHEGHSSHD